MDNIEFAIDNWTLELTTFIRKYTPTGWTEPIGTCCYVPFSAHYYMEIGSDLPWYIEEAVEAFKQTR